MRRGVGQRIVEKISDGLGDALFVHQRLECRGRIQNQAQSPLLCGRQIELENLSEESLQIADLQMELQGLVLTRARGKDGLNQLRSSVNFINPSSRRIQCICLIGMIEDAFQIPPNPGERRAQLMSQIVIGILEFGSQTGDPIQSIVVSHGERLQLGHGCRRDHPIIGAALCKRPRALDHGLHWLHHVTGEPQERQQHEQGGGEARQPQFAPNSIHVGGVLFIRAPKP